MCCNFACIPTPALRVKTSYLTLNSGTKLKMRFCAQSNCTWSVRQQPIMADILKDSKTRTFWGLCVVLLTSYLCCSGWWKFSEMQPKLEHLVYLNRRLNKLPSSLQGLWTRCPLKGAFQPKLFYDFMIHPSIFWKACFIRMFFHYFSLYFPLFFSSSLYVGKDSSFYCEIKTPARRFCFS